MEWTRRKMFIGQYHTMFDAKGRLGMPTQYKELLSGGAYVTQGFERNLMVLSSKAFHNLYGRMIGTNMADPLARQLVRMILGSATPAKLDEAGHLQIPERLSKFASLENDVVLVGQGEHFEIWSSLEWSTQENLLFDVEANANRFSAFELCGN
jgi:MraZ protein